MQQEVRALLLVVHIEGGEETVAWEVREEVCRLAEHGKRPEKGLMEQDLLKKTN